jgi:hypothetical protein
MSIDSHVVIRAPHRQPNPTPPPETLTQSTLLSIFVQVATCVLARHHLFDSSLYRLSYNIVPSYSRNTLSVEDGQELLLRSISQLATLRYSLDDTRAMHTQYSYQYPIVSPSESIDIIQLVTISSFQISNSSCYVL